MGLLDRRAFTFLAGLAVSAIAAAALPAGAENGGLGPTPLSVPSKFGTSAFKTKRTLNALPGIRISVFASGLGGPRFMAVDARGNLFVTVPSQGSVVVLPDSDKDGVADRVITFAKGLNKPHGITFSGDDVIVAETGALVLLSDKNKDLEADEKKFVTKDVPPGGGHWTRTVVKGPDGALYVSAGSSCNACMEKDKRRAAVMRFEGDEGKLYATGLRNTVGMAFHPDTKELWGVDNGRDLLGDDIPPEELNRITKGGDYGWPRCYGKRIPDPEYGSHERCANTVLPVVEMQAHSAPLGITFGKGLKAPDKYKEMLFIGFHGSWNRTVPTGYKLVAIPFKDGKPAGGSIDIITGWHTDGETWGRPVAPVVGGDGALYLSDDRAGAVYRITFEGAQK